MHKLCANFPDTVDDFVCRAHTGLGSLRTQHAEGLQNKHAGADSNHSQIMTQLGTAIRMYTAQSLNASVVQPGQVHRLGSWLRVCNTQHVTISIKLVNWTAFQATAAPISPKPALLKQQQGHLRMFSGSSSSRCTKALQKLPAQQMWKFAVTRHD